MPGILKLRDGRRGQALLLVTLSLVAMCGLLGLAVDLGWSYFVKKSAQNAADSAALAAAYQALGPTETGSFTASASGGTDCDGVTGNLLTGCHYAEKNDFSPNGHGGRQKVNMQDGIGDVRRQDGTPPLTSCTTNPGLVGCVDYWVTVRAVELIPQLFSAVLGNATGLSSARSTAAVVEAQVNGSLILLNRTSDPGPNGTGIDAVASPIAAAAGLVVASTAPGTVPTSGITGPVIAMKPLGSPPMPDGPFFLDPMRGYGQPPLPTSPLDTYVVIGSNMNSSPIYKVGNDKVVDFGHQYGGGGSPTLPSGNYVSATFAPGCGPGSCGSVLPTGNQLSIGGTVTFSDPAPFGYYLFYGGLNVVGKMIMSPGEYVMVGGGPGGNLVTSNTAEIDGNGAIMILTGASGPFTGDATTAAGPADLYPYLLAQINSNAFLVAAAEAGQLTFGPVSLSPGPAGNVTGLDPTSPTVPQNLLPFCGIVLWQDQANSTMKYQPDGNIDVSCGGISTPCTKAAPNAVLSVNTTNNMGFTGTIYQPRGAWIDISGGTLKGNLQVITGAVIGGTAISLAPPSKVIPNLILRRRVVALVE